MSLLLLKSFRRSEKWEKLIGQKNYYFTLCPLSPSNKRWVLEIWQKETFNKFFYWPKLTQFTLNSIDFNPFISLCWNFIGGVRCELFDLIEKVHGKDYLCSGALWNLSSFCKLYGPANWTWYPSTNEARKGRCILPRCSPYRGRSSEAGFEIMGRRRSMALG